MDVFDLELYNVGELKSIYVGHDNFGPGAAWHLDKVCGWGSGGSWTRCVGGAGA